MHQTEPPETLSLRIENVGGIDETSVELSPGLTVLSGRNATNRTSLLQAFVAALGGDGATLKGDAETGRVELEMEGTTATRELERRDGRTVLSGDPYLDDATLAELFAFLLEDNPARRAIRTGGSIRAVIMRPVDTDEIEATIRARRRERDEVSSRIGELETVSEELSEHRAELAAVDEEIEAKREALAETRAEIEAVEGSLDGVDGGGGREDGTDGVREGGGEGDRAGEPDSEGDGDGDELTQRVQALSDRRAELEAARSELRAERESLAALREEREELREDRDGIEAVPDERLDELADELARRRERQAAVESQLDQLQTVVRFNERRLEGSLELFGDGGDREPTGTGDPPGGGAPTDLLLEDGDRVTCWTCGSEVSTEHVEATLDALRERRSELGSARRDLGSGIDELVAEREALRERATERERLAARIETVADEIEDREARVETLERRVGELTDAVDEMAAAVTELRERESTDDEHLELHRRANRHELAVERLEADRAELASTVERLEDELAEREELVERREALTAELASLRTRVEELERDAVQQFNDHMERVLEVLSYENIARIWIERVETGPDRAAGGAEASSAFDLHVVRRTPDGALYEDDLAHLSESEREVTGLVVALAGYLVHEVGEAVPVILLDSIEAIDASRLARLIDYLDDHTDYLVAALLEEDAAALEGEHRTITDI